MRAPERCSDHPEAGERGSGSALTTESLASSRVDPQAQIAAVRALAKVAPRMDAPTHQGVRCWRAGEHPAVNRVLPRIGSIAAARAGQEDWLHRKDLAVSPSRQHAPSHGRGGLHPHPAGAGAETTGAGLTVIDRKPAPGHHGVLVRGSERL